MSRLRTMLPMIAVAVLAACSTVPTTSQPQGPTLTCDPLLSKMPECLRRMEGLAGAAAVAGVPWQMRGRAAINHGSQSGSVGVEWDDAASLGYTVTLRAPVTGQSWQLSDKGGTATLTGVPGGSRSGNDAALLLQAATGFAIPVRQMRHWVRGFADPTLPVQRYVFVGDQLVTLLQDGWRIDVLTRDAEGRPQRINAVRETDKVKLVADRWGAP